MNKNRKGQDVTVGDDDFFRQAMEGQGVAPLEDDDTRPHRLPVSHRARKPSRAADGAFEPVAFQIEVVGEIVEGHAPDVGREPLKKLRRGKFPVEAELDLHGLTEREAHRAVRDELALAWRRGERCLLVIHGKGLHSDGPAVLKERLPGWLAEPPHGRRVLAFATVPQNTGEMRVLLKRRKSKKG